MNKSIPPGYSFFPSMVRTYKQAKNPIGAMVESMTRFNGTYTVNLGMMRLIATQDGGLIEHVLKSNHRNYHKSQIQTEYLGKFLGKGLLTVNGDYWLKQRRLIQPGFHAEKIHALYAIIKNTIDEFLSTVPTGHVDVYPLMHKLAFDIVINTLFTVDVPTAQRQKLASFISDVQEYVMREVRNPHKRWWFRLSGELQENLDKAAGARDVIRSLIRQRQHDKGRHNDLLDMLLEARYEESGQPMTEEQVIDEILIILIAGHETTANALSWSLYLLAQHPDELQIAKEASRSLELQQIVGNEALNNVIKESMRLYPPAWISDRVALEDDEYADFSIPKGTVIVIFYYGLHRDPNEWGDALSFKPSRFSKEHTQDIKKIYYPFGAGPRLCIGNNFAMAEMVIFLQSFIQMFHVAPGNAEPTMKPLVTLRPDKVMLKVTKVG
ncbi:cytochrome P450 [Chryseolinea lacunae]|uniref:Cytochrome P450 n=1 Tax=Chryseolinea lacunae TaxID=2801331 RepID=A0ABS1KMM1_9BACT|nr:cytochrome P450 [Chryseolinea lacunae]MBL0740696.1 cytochrome P450 [Chryseolinea lacunae]